MNWCYFIFYLKKGLHLTTYWRLSQIQQYDSPVEEPAPPWWWGKRDVK